MIAKDCYATIVFKDGTERTMLAKGGAYHSISPKVPPFSVDGTCEVMRKLGGEWIELNGEIRRTSEVAFVKYSEIERDVEPQTNPYV